MALSGYFGLTDQDWYEFLGARDLPEVNFWQPSGGKAFRAIPTGAPFLFKLKSPHNAIGGFGCFVRHSVLPAWLAWESFEEANGAPDIYTMRTRIEKYRKRQGSDLAGEYHVGCIILSEPVFFPPAEWVTQPSNWKPNIQQGHTYDLTKGEGKRVWDECLLRAQSVPKAADTVLVASGQRYGKPSLVKPRLGQGAFRVAVTEAYDRACAITQEHSLPALEAAHIRPYGEGGQHAVANGLLLRSDIHRLFDKGYVTLTQDHRFEVSRRLKDDYDNGKSYYPLHGNVAHLPPNPADQPSSDFLAWHNENCYRG